MRHLIAKLAFGSAVCLNALAVAAIPVRAQQDKYHITPSERAACTADATRLCANTYPDETKLLGCMRENRASLSSPCLVAFDAGVKRRHITER